MRDLRILGGGPDYFWGRRRQASAHICVPSSSYDASNLSVGLVRVGGVISVPRKSSRPGRDICFNSAVIYCKHIWRSNGFEIVYVSGRTKQNCSWVIVKVFGLFSVAQYLFTRPWPSQSLHS